jgi:hypothetical protein
MLIPTPPQGKRRFGKSRRVIQPARRGAFLISSASDFQIYCSAAVALP